MKKFIYIFAMFALIVSSSFLSSCTADEIADDSKNQFVVNATADVDPPVAAERPK